MKEYESDALAVKYRPTSFSAIVGQDNAVGTLRDGVIEGSVKAAYIFSGPSGTGKTTLAQVLDVSVNCDHDGRSASGKGDACQDCQRSYRPFHVFDCSMDRSGSSWDDIIRNLELTRLGSMAVYIFDEAHYLPPGIQGKFYALLDLPSQQSMTLVFCTTDPQMLTPALRGRCIGVEFVRLSDQEVSFLIDRVAQDEQLTIDDDQRLAILATAEGSGRDALRLIQTYVVENRPPGVGDVVKLVQAILADDLHDAFALIAAAEDSHRLDAAVTVRLLYVIWRSGLVVSAGGKCTIGHPDIAALMPGLAGRGGPRLQAELDTVMSMDAAARSSSTGRIALESIVARLIFPSDVLGKLQSIENMVREMTGAELARRLQRIEQHLVTSASEADLSVVE